MIILDTSAALELLVSAEPDRRLIERVGGDGDLHAPHLIDVEFLHALRRLVTRDLLSLDRANDARTDFSELTITRYPHEPLADRAWALRDTVTAYDAMFVALAEAVGAPLITCDRRLAAAPGVTAAVEVYGTP